jgi:hypothetical protein
MDGTFRAHVESGAAPTVRFASRAAALPERRWPAEAALLLAGCCLAALPQLAPRPKAPDNVTVRAPRPTPLSLAAAPIPHSPQLSPTTHAARHRANSRRSAPPPKIFAAPQAKPLAQTPEPLDPIFVALPEATPAASIPTVEDKPLPAPPLAVDLPGPPIQVLAVADEPPAAPVPSTASSSAARETLREVDIAQISQSDVPSLRVTQLNEPGLAVGAEPNLAAKIAAMQVTPLPPVRYPQSERAVLLAEAPTQMMVRIGGAEVGKVEFRMTDARTIDVKLAGLLDLLATHYDASEFTRLRNSAAADAYVSFDKLRAMGLNVRYDPVYDEVRIAG